MSSLVLTLDDTMDVEAAAAAEAAELEFSMADEPTIKPKKQASQSDDQSINRKRKREESFLSDLVQYDALPADEDNQSGNQPLIQRTHLDVWREKVQDHLSKKKFYREQRKARGEDVSESENEDEIVKQEDDEESDEEQSNEQSTKQPNDRSNEQPIIPSDDDDSSAPAPLIITEWKGTKQQMLAIRDFGELSLSRPLLRALTDVSFTTPTPVQSAVIPHALAGRDLLANAMTGSGKTAAFMLPILERLLHRSKRAAVSRVLVLLPTRELAVQCQQMTASLARYTDIRTCLVVGGMSENVQLEELKQRPDIVIGTPGRVIDHLRNSPSVHLDGLEVLVLDEADRLLELGFIEEMKEILRMCPKQRQTLLFSATLSSSVNELIMLSLKDPMKITIDSNQAIVDSLTQEFIRLRTKNESGAEAMREREAYIFALAKRSFTTKTLIFVPSKDECHRLFLLFSLSNLSACELQGSLTQLQRLEALDAFKKNKVNFLICTDLASRGLDIAGVETVINMTMPRDLKTYIHRVGRTARAGRRGRAITLVGYAERKQVKTLVSRSNERVHARVIPPAVVAAEMERLEKLEDDVNEMLEEEKMEKEQRVAEAEINRAKNKLIHEEEIMMRPKKTWFQNEQEKLASKLASVRNFDTKALLKGELNTHNQADEYEEDEDGKKTKKQKDPLRGLSREAKRRKLMRMEAEQEAAERRAARDAGEDVPMSVNPRALAHHAKKAQQKKYEDEDAHGSNKKPKPLRVVPAGSKFSYEDNSVDKRYRVRARDTAKEKKLADLEKARHKPSKGGSFKSKSKHKRK